MERFEERVLAACKELLAPGDRVIAAVSGGADSMALLQFLLEYKDALGVGVEAAHVDHHMRPDSARDAAFVAKFCQKNGVPLHAFAAAAPPARPSEEWCRELRYGFFETLAAPGVKIATAHT
ncbi:tRNA lysidine(34) synthetase, partial [Allofournierella sp.]|uniref:tRNA lysidine(34) synthetase n=1 Tax=Allofournierella sp. TaxID=1940256 RepID=UPI002E78C928